MRRSRVSIRAAVAGVAGLGLAFGALRGSSDLWWIATVLATWGLLAWATLGAIVLRGSDRAPWLGIAVFGWLFFAMTHSNRLFPDFSKGIYDGVAFLGQAVHPDPQLLDLPPGANPPPSSYLLPRSAPSEEEERINRANMGRRLHALSLRSNFSATLLLLLNIAFAFGGGIAGRSFAARSVPVSPASPGPTPVEQREAT